MDKIYFDNSSTSFPKAPGLGEEMCLHLNSASVNVGRGGYTASYEVGEAVIKTRQELCEFFSFDKWTNVIFTSGLTFSLNLILFGLLKKGDQVIISSMEHNAVARPLEFLKRTGVEAAVVQCNQRGELDMEYLEKQILPNTKAIVVTHASNVCGTLHPVNQIGELSKKYGIHFILDAAQTAGIIPIDFYALNLSALCFSGHKGLLGPQGIGGFLISDELSAEITPFVYGGTGSISSSFEMPDFLPDIYEAGTLNIPGIISLSHCIKYINTIGVENIRIKEEQLCKRFLNSILDYNNIKIYGMPTEENRIAIVSIEVKGKDCSDISYKLEKNFGIMTRSGLHCSPLSHKTLGTYPKGTVRFSFGYHNTFEEIDHAVNALSNI